MPLSNPHLLTTADLKCEYAVNPMGIDTLSPRLSWELKSERRGQRQKAYRILAATSPELLGEGLADLWDSGRVESRQSVHVEYAGAPLRSGMRCFWKVKTWDTSGNESPWSDSGFWEMGLLDENDWKGRWIGGEPPTIPEGKTSGPSPILRRVFDLDQPVVSARAYICGLGFHELYLNGCKVGDHVLDPAVTKYDRRALYVTHDVTEMIQQGTNSIGVMLGNGFYNSHTEDAWNFHTAPWRDLPKMLLQINVTLADGSRINIVSDGEWKTSTGPIVFDGLRNGETYDARLEKKGWLLPNFDDSDWTPARIVPGPGGMLASQTMPPCKVMQTLTPVSVTETRPGVFVYDLGQNFAGWAQISVSGDAGTEVKLAYSEILNEDGEPETAAISTCLKSGDFQTDRYILKGEGIEVWEPRFTYHGFRYVQVTGFPGTPTLDNLRGRVVHTAFESAGEFACSNELLNTIQKCTLWSYVSNFVGIPTDCPQREKNGWTGDACLAAETGAFNFTSQSSYTKWMDDFADEQRLSGQLPGIVPTGGWGYNWGSGPAWDSAYTHIPWCLYVYSGDKRILKTHFDRMKRYVDYMTSMSTGDTVSFGLGDWCPPNTGGEIAPTKLTSTAYYYANCRILAGIADLLGKTSDREYYSLLATKIKAAFNKEFYDPADGRYADGGQTSQACTLFQDIVPHAEREKVLSRLISSIAETDNHPGFGILGAKYVLNVLTDSGRADLAYKMVTQTTYPSWGHWIEQGATTLWETWEGKASLNHIMFGDVSSWMFKTLAGIAPDYDHPGFQHFECRPHVLGDVTWVKAEHKTMYGRIQSDWKIGADSLEYHVEIPVNTAARVFLPARDQESVSESGRPVTEADGVAVVGMEDGCLVMEVGSGEYDFEVAFKAS